MAKYYKKVWGAFSSPILNAQNYANYVTDTNIADVYKLFDGNTGTYVYLGSSSYYVNLRFPNEVDLTNFVLSAQRYNPVWPPSSVKFYAKADNTWSYLGGFNQGSIAWEGGLNMSYSLDNHIASKEIRIEIGGGTLVAGGGQTYSAYALELSFTGQQITSIVEITEAEYEANKDNSDYFKVDSVVVKDYLATQRKYYKKVNTIVESPWTQPVLKNGDAPLGGNSFAVQSKSNTSGSYHDWQAFDGNVNTWWISGETGTNADANANYYIYNPVPLHITNIYIDGGSYYYEGRFNKLVVFGSNDNSNYTLIDTIQTTLQNTYNLQIKNNNGYKYYKFNFQNTNNPSPGYISIKEIKLTATQLIGGTSWQECTKEEYDNLPADQRKIVTDVYNGFVRKKILESETKDVPFVQPILTANGTLGGDSFAVYCNTTVADYQKNHPAWKAFDGNPDTDCTMGVYNYEHIIMYNPVPIKVSSLSSTRKSTASNEYYKFSASNDNATWVTLLGETNSGSTVNFKWDFPNNNAYYKYFKFEGKNVSGGSVNVYEMKLEGTIKATIPTKAVNCYYACAHNQAFEEVVVERAWEQPILTSNGTLGGSSFAVSASSEYDSNRLAYKAFDGNNNTWWQGSPLVSLTTGYIIAYNPLPLKVSSIQFRNANDASYGHLHWVSSVSIYGSEDNSLYTLLKTQQATSTSINTTWNVDISTSNAYKYIKIEMTSGGQQEPEMGEITITATEQVKQLVPV